MSRVHLGPTGRTISNSFFTTEPTDRTKNEFEVYLILAPKGHFRAIVCSNMHNKKENLLSCGTDFVVAVSPCAEMVPDVLVLERY